MVCLKDTGFILVRTEYPYVQFVAVARVTSTGRYEIDVVGTAHLVAAARVCEAED